MALKSLFIAAALLLSSMAHAVCYRDGKPYPTGAVVGGYTCMPDGTWRR